MSGSTTAANETKLYRETERADAESLFEASQFYVQNNINILLLLFMKHTVYMQYVCSKQQGTVDKIIYFLFQCNYRQCFHLFFYFVWPKVKSNWPCKIFSKCYFCLFYDLFLFCLFAFQGSRLTIFTRSTVAPDWKLLWAQAENVACNAIVTYFLHFNCITDKCFENK